MDEVELPSQDRPEPLPEPPVGLREGRKRGAQPGNSNRWVHGRRSVAAIHRRKTGAASRKLAATILVSLHALPGYRCRPRPLRKEQFLLLDPVGRRIALELAADRL
jgi:hypothetical protein